MSAPQALNAPHKLSGLDKLFYANPEVHPHQFSWTERPAYCTFHESMKIEDAYAGSREARVQVECEGDLLYTSYIQAFRPGIRGKYDERAMVPYPSLDRRHTRLADKRAMERFADAERYEFGDGDDELDTRNKAEREAALISRFVNKMSGNVGVRNRTDIEEDALRPSRGRRSGRSRAVDDTRSRASRASRASRGSRSVFDGAGAGAGEALGYDADSRTHVSEATIDPGRQKHFAFYIPNWLSVYIESDTVEMSTVPISSTDFHARDAIFDLRSDLNTREGWREVTENPPPFASEEEEIMFLVAASADDGEAWLPLQHDWCWYEEKALRLNATIYARPIMKFKINTLTSIIKRSDRHTIVVKADGSELKESDITLRFVGKIIVLDARETELHKQKHDVIHEYVRQKTVSNNGARFNPEINLKYMGPTVSVHWWFQRNCAVRDNNHFDYRGILDKPPMTACEILATGKVLQQEQTEKFYRQILPLETTGSAPTRHIYSYVPGNTMFPRELDTSLNTTRYSTLTAVPKYQPGLDREDVKIYTMRRGLMLLRYENKMAMPYYHIRTAATPATVGAN